MSNDDRSLEGWAQVIARSGEQSRRGNVLVWQIQAQVETIEDSVDGARWTGSRQVPSFLIDRRIQGAQDIAGAERIAREVLNPIGAIPDERIHVHVIARNMGV